jgi:NAD(P)-dependent dehydrogenase (short-subunit alcohol dehydrogenase family)
MAKSAASSKSVKKQRRIQAQQDVIDEQSSKSKKPKKGESEDARKPQPPFPSQHLAKPGKESALQKKPNFLAPTYQGSNKLKGKVAVITGGDSGIGRAVAVLYAREKADIAIIYLDEDDDARATAKQVEKEGRRCLLIRGDVKDPRFCESAIKKVLKAFGQIDILVNNAAFQEHADSLLDITEERFDETLRTNVYGYFHMARAVLPHLKPGAAIVNTGSVTGLKGNGQLLDYSTTKGAIHAFTMSLAANLVEKGIRVNAVAPGPVWTPLNPADKPAAEVAEFGAQTSFKRPAQPEEISPAYVFLAANSCSSYITGIVLPITGSVGE